MEAASVIAPKFIQTGSGIRLDPDNLQQDLVQFCTSYDALELSTNPFLDLARQRDFLIFLLSGEFQSAIPDGFQFIGVQRQNGFEKCAQFVKTIRQRTFDEDSGELTIDEIAEQSNIEALSSALIDDSYNEETSGISYEYATNYRTNKAIIADAIDQEVNFLLDDPYNRTIRAQTQLDFDNTYLVSEIFYGEDFLPVAISLSLTPTKKFAINGGVDETLLKNFNTSLPAEADRRIIESVDTLFEPKLDQEAMVTHLKDHFGFDLTGTRSDFTWTSFPRQTFIFDKFFQIESSATKLKYNPIRQTLFVCYQENPWPEEVFILTTCRQSSHLLHALANQVKLSKLEQDPRRTHTMKRDEIVALLQEENDKRYLNDKQLQQMGS